MGMNGGGLSSQPLVIGFDGGNSKSDLAVATLGGEPLAYVRGPGTNSHGIGAPAVNEVVGRLVRAAGVGTGTALAAAALFCCGADLPQDIDALEAAFSGPGSALGTSKVFVDNDTFALLHAGREHPDAVAVICGAGINVVGQASTGQVVRYPALGWESGDWGGSEMVGREALFLSARARDGRGEGTVLARLIEEHFHCTLEDLAVAVHYRHLPLSRLGELAPGIITVAAHDAVAAGLLGRLASEVALLAWRALRDLDALSRTADVVLGGGMLGAARLRAQVEKELSARAPRAQPVFWAGPPVVGAVCWALEMAGAPPAAAGRFREHFEMLGAPRPVP